MAAIPPVDGSVSAWRPTTDSRLAQPSRTAAAPHAEGSEPQPASLTEQAVQAAFDQARLEEWADRIRALETASSLLVERPAPDSHRPGYPSAIQAYHEVSKLIETI